jgi:hypothetical protein
MPDLCIPPPNQCTASGPEESDEALQCLAQPSLPSTQPTAEFGGTDGAEGGAATGAEELVRRFSDAGAGGAPGTPGALSPEDRSCLKEDLRLLASCLPLLGGGATGPLAIVYTGSSCASALLTELECQTR